MIPGGHHKDELSNSIGGKFVAQILQHQQIANFKMCPTRFVYGGFA